MKTLTPIFHLCALTALVGCTGVKVDDDNNNPDSNDTAGSNDDGDAALYGPENEWYHATADAVPSPDSCGFQQGDYACNFTMLDQNGDEVELYQFAGKYVVLDLFAEW